MHDDTSIDPTPRDPDDTASLPPHDAGDDDATLPAARSKPTLGPGDLPAPDPHPPGSRIGPYTVVQRIAAGGHGAVYRCRGTGGLTRDVAVKVIHPDRGGEQVLGRFRVEMESLALFDHEGIARVFDAGLLENERPWFAMEYVAGLPITEFCRKRRLDLPARLRLFAKVCRAVDHAHAKGVIHRDLKPSNILVAGERDDPVVKVIDFGVAKALHGPLVAQQVVTLDHHVVGTLPYMAPEQADQQEKRIDRRSDVYGLGVVLYELVTGDVPYPETTLAREGFEAMRRRIVTGRPEPPSTRISGLTPDERSSLADEMRTRFEDLVRELKADVGWVTLKALERDAEDRFASAAHLADAVDSYLRGDLEVPGTPLGRKVRRFVKRHRGLVAGTAGAMAALLAVTAVVASLWMAAANARDVAKAEREAADTAREVAVAEREAADTARAAAVDSAQAARRDRDRAVEAERAATISADVLRALADVVGDARSSAITFDEAAETVQGALVRVRELLASVPEQWALHVSSASSLRETAELLGGTRGRSLRLPAIAAPLAAAAQDILDDVGGEPGLAPELAAVIRRERGRTTRLRIDLVKAIEGDEAARARAAMVEARLSEFDPRMASILALQRLDARRRAADDDPEILEAVLPDLRRIVDERRRRLDAAAGPDRRTAARDLAVALGRLSYVLYLLEGAEASAASDARMLALREEGLAADPTSPRTRRDMMVTLEQVAPTLQGVARVEAAERMLGFALELNAEFPGDARGYRDLVRIGRVILGTLPADGEGCPMTWPLAPDVIVGSPDRAARLVAQIEQGAELHPQVDGGSCVVAAIARRLPS